MKTDRRGFLKWAAGFLGAVGLGALVEPFDSFYGTPHGPATSWVRCSAEFLPNPGTGKFIVIDIIRSDGGKARLRKNGVEYDGPVELRLS